ncbi:MAG TPA: ArsR family transcriptional regulator [Candidatus Altiarchaeales archaeon]|nr:ArsR family transcriptional regulator [Candidatus Altiarchaeales archaeon]
MIDDKIVLDRETFKALAIETRIKILKLLDEKFQLTLTDLSKELGLAPSTVKEHLEKLMEAGLVKQIDKGMKWKYYRLTSKGSRLLNPHEKRVLIILASTVIALFFSLYALLYKLERAMSGLYLMGTKMITPQAVEKEIIGGNVYENVSKMFAMREAAPSAMGTTTTTIPAKLYSVPYLELIAVIILTLIIGICVGYLLKRKKLF